MVAKLKKAIYSTLLVARIFYDKLRSFLESDGFEVNPYDECTFNKVMNNNQCTIQFHVNDLMISHVDISCIETCMEKLNNEFGKIKPLQAVYGQVHEYLGLTIDFSNPKEVKFTMYDYLEDILDESKGDMKGVA